MDAETSFWDKLKHTLDDEMTKDELAEVIFLMNDKLKQNGLKNSFLLITEDRKPSDILSILENNMSLKDAFSVVKHVLAYMKLHRDMSTESFESIIDVHEADQMPHSSHIIGREDLISYAYNLFKTFEYQGIWISGLGGYGKTVLAQEVCSRLKHKDKFHYVHVDLKQVDSVYDMLKTILCSLKLQSMETDENLLIKEIVFELRSFKHDTCILIDNIENVYDRSAKNVNEFLQKCLKATVDQTSRKMKLVFTSRNELDVTLSDKIASMVLPPLSHDHADHLLQLTCRPKELSKKERDLILQMTGGIPFAIHLVACEIKENSDLNLDSRQMFLSATLQIRMNNCIKYAFEHLPKIIQSQLKMLSVFEAAKFEVGDVAAILNIAVEDAICFLLYLSRQQIVQNENIMCKDNQFFVNNYTWCIYYFHPLVFEFLKGLQQDLKDNEDKQISQRRFCKHMLQKLEWNFGKTNANYGKVIDLIQSNRSLLTIFFEHFSMNMEGGLSESQSRYFCNMLVLLYSLKHEEALLKKMIAKYVQMHDVYSEIFWSIELCYCYICMNEKQSYINAEQVLDKLQALFDNNSHLDADKMIHLKAKFYYAKGRYHRLCDKKDITEAQSCFNNSISLYNKTKSNDVNRELALVLDAMGNTYYDNGKFEQSLEYHTQASNVFREVTHEAHPDMSLFDFNIGTIHLALAMNIEYMGQTKKEHLELALKKFNSCILQDEDLKLSKHPRFANKLEARSQTYAALGRYNEAISDMKRVIEIRKSVYANTHSDIILAYCKLGNLYVEWRGTFRIGSEESRTCIKEAIESFREAEEIIRDGGQVAADKKMVIFKNYRKIATEKLLDTRMAQKINQFLNRFEHGNSFESSSSEDDLSEASNDQDSSSSDQDKRVHDEGNYTDSMDTESSEDMDMSESHINTETDPNKYGNSFNVSGNTVHDNFKESQTISNKLKVMDIGVVTNSLNTLRSFSGIQDNIESDQATTRKSFRKRKASDSD